MSKARPWDDLALSQCVGGGALTHLANVPDDERLWMSQRGRSELGQKLVLCLGTIEGESFRERVSGELTLKDTTYVTGSLLYFDTATKRLRLVYKEGYGEQPLTVFEARGKQLKLVKTTGAGKTSSYDALSYDPKRSVLVHVLQMGRHSDTEEGVRLRELHAGKWRDAGELFGDVSSQSSYVWAGWDGARELTVVIDDSGNCAGWDGAKWHQLPKLSGGCWVNPHFALTGEGRLTVVFEERKYRSNKKLLRVLGEKGWLGHTHDGLIAHGPGVCDPGAGRARYLDANFVGQGRCQWAEVDVVRGNTLAWRLVPPYLPTFSGVVAHGGELLLWGSSPMYRWSGDAIVPCPPADDSLLGLVGGGKVHAVAAAGTVYLRQGDGWKKQPSKGFVPCEDAALARRPDGSILLCGGRGPGYGSVIKQTWSWSRQQGGWTKLATKGRQPQLAKAAAAWDEGRERLVVTGGQTNRDTEDATYEFDGKRWQRFEGGLSMYEHKTLAYDASSGILFAPGYAMIRVYRGEGNWEECSPPYEVQWGTIAYDPLARELWCAGAAGGIAKFPLGPWLDELAGVSAVSASTQGAADQPASATARKPEKAKKASKPKASKGPGSRYLRCTDDGADKFWIATVKGKTVALHWGRRGSKGQRKTHSHPSPKAARAAYDKQVAKKLDAGYWDAPEKEKACEIPGRWAHTMSFGGRAVDAVGGLPRVSAKRWPTCADCSHPMSHVLTLRGHDERLPLNKHAGLAVFMCLHEESAGCCETWEAFGGANAVLLLSQKEMKARPLRSAPVGTPPVVERLPIRYERTFEPDPESEDTPYGDMDNKVGGHPEWYQGADVPSCRKCNKEMRFVAQLSEIAEPLNFGGDGIAYAFVCPDEHEGAFLWQCG